ncbi:hypothetical protein [Pontibacter sp. G13]|uniref:hypothetical protein n=1 Tax=Pontibacter sp. G13 TaxID=3074898 RepID=UPI0028893707|nr:hypothetical protein [Pontibacter sp. G13]WNJ16076.1 hypothetical protein RJD25_14530 [Pontibacter sp. G13]
MDNANTSPLSWQTGVLTFRNKSISEVKQLLESRYGTHVPMYHERRNSWSPDWEIPSPNFSKKEEELRLILFLNYNPDTEAMHVRGIHLGAQ